MPLYVDLDSYEPPAEAHSSFAATARPHAEVEHGFSFLGRVADELFKQGDGLLACIACACKLSVIASNAPENCQ